LQGGGTVPTPPTDAPPDGDVGAEATLEEQLARAQADTEAMRQRMLRVAADFDNFRKRAGRDIEDSRRRGVQAAVRELLPVFDNLERATSHVGEGADPSSLVNGLQMVHRLFQDTLRKLGIERVTSEGAPFDPSVHDGIQHEHAEVPAGTVTRELQPGYRMENELLRPALVVVSRGPVSVESEGSDGAADPAHGGNGAPPAENSPSDE
jgi:molecular chaperone GrpE